MPNWACGPVEVTGKRSGVVSFVERFIDHDDGVTEGKRFFARSFLADCRKDLLKEIKEAFKEQPDDKEMTFGFYVSFAWSAYTCVIGGYPETSPTELITLSEACVEDAVSVTLWTDEPGMCFAEDLSCDPEGKISYSTEDYRDAKCRTCGSTQGVSSRENLEEVECCECGAIGFDYVEEE